MMCRGQRGGGGHNVQGARGRGGGMMYRGHGARGRHDVQGTGGGMMSWHVCAGAGEG